MFPKSTRILVVDDFMTARLIVKKALKELGYNNIHESKNGEEAWEALRDAGGSSDPFQLVISDWNMPVMSGIDLVKKIREDKKFHTLPLLLITAEGGRDQVIEALEAGVSGMIIKPFSADQLSEKLAEIYESSNDAMGVA